jgi:hypothetical protein
MMEGNCVTCGRVECQFIIASALPSVNEVLPMGSDVPETQSGGDC